MNTFCEFYTKKLDQKNHTFFVHMGNHKSIWEDVESSSDPKEGDDWDEES